MKRFLRPLTVEEGIDALIMQFGLERVQATVLALGHSKLKSTGDASRDRVVSERLGLRV